jgi:hypothetical protein
MRTRSNEATCHPAQAGRPVACVEKRIGRPDTDREVSKG